MSKIIKLVQLNKNRPVIIEHSLPELSLEFAKEEIAIAEEAARQPEITPEEAARIEAERILLEAEGRAQEMLEKAGQEAETLLSQARDEAELLTKTSQEEAQALLERSRKEGYEAGYQEALEKARLEAEAILDEARVAAEGAYREKEAFLKAKEPEMIQLALAIAKKILHHEVTAREDVVLAIAQSCLQKSPGTVVTIKVNSADYPVIHAHYGDLLTLCQGEELKILQDDRIQQGGCIIETEDGFLDAQLESQFAQVVEALMKVVS